MREEIFFDFVGQRKLIFDEDSVSHFTDEIYFVIPIPLPFVDVGLGYSVVTNCPIRYSEIRSIGVVRKRQWWALVMAVLFCPMWLYCIGAGVITGDWSQAFTWGFIAFCILWLAVTGLLPLWMFFRGRPFLAIASDSQAICVPMDRSRAKVRQAFELLKTRVRSPAVRWEIAGI